MSAIQLLDKTHTMVSQYANRTYTSPMFIRSILTNLKQLQESGINIDRMKSGFYGVNWNTFTLRIDE